MGGGGVEIDHLLTNTFKYRASVYIAAQPCLHYLNGGSLVPLNSGSVLSSGHRAKVISGKALTCIWELTLIVVEMFQRNTDV